jgi:hypothetical protein
MPESESGSQSKPLSNDLLIHVDEDSQRPTIEWSENLYDRIMEEAEDICGGLYHDRELAIVGQAVDGEIFVVCPAPRGNAVQPALRKIGFEPERVDYDTSKEVFRIESNMEIDDV